MSPDFAPTVSSTLQWTLELQEEIQGTYRSKLIFQKVIIKLLPWTNCREMILTHLKISDLAFKNRGIFILILEVTTIISGKYFHNKLLTVTS